MAKVDLRIDWATHAAAKYACENWHYSGCLPAGKLVKIGAWENRQFVGVVLFGTGSGQATNGVRYGLNRAGDVCELARVALADHQSSVSRIIAVAVRFLRQATPNIRLIISFADTRQGHHGGIYQAGNWIYTGVTQVDREFYVKGKTIHARSIPSRGWIQNEKWLKDNIDPNARRIKTPGKHRYLMPLDAEMRERILPLAKPYPKRAKQAMTGPPAQRQGSTDPHAPEQTTGGTFFQVENGKGENEQDAA